jgi:hypothetical protein
VRKGEDVALAARQVVVSRFDVRARRGDDLDVRVVCSSGTYVRALARDVGAALGVGGHLTALRRTRVGPFGLDAARTLDQLAQDTDAAVVRLDDAVAAAFPRRDLTEQEAGRAVVRQEAGADRPRRRARCLCAWRAAAPRWSRTATVPRAPSWCSRRPPESSGGARARSACEVAPRARAVEQPATWRSRGAGLLAGPAQA